MRQDDVVRLLGVLLLAGGLGLGAGIVGGGLTGLVWGVVSWTPMVIWLVPVSAFAGAQVGAVAGVAAAAASLLTRRAKVPAPLGRLVVALAAAVAGVAVASYAFGSYLAFPLPTIGGIFVVIALGTGLGAPVLEKVSRRFLRSPAHGVAQEAAS